MRAIRVRRRIAIINYDMKENVEMTVLVHQFYGRRWHIIMQIFVYGAMQSTNIASIVLTAQVCYISIDT